MLEQVEKTSPEITPQPLREVLSVQSYAEDSTWMALRVENNPRTMDLVAALSDLAKSLPTTFEGRRPKVFLSLKDVAHVNEEDIGAIIMLGGVCNLSLADVGADVSHSLQRFGAHKLLRIEESLEILDSHPEFLYSQGEDFRSFELVLDAAWIREQGEQDRALERTQQAAQRSARTAQAFVGEVIHQYEDAGVTHLTINPGLTELIDGTDAMKSFKAKVIEAVGADKESLRLCLQGLNRLGSEGIGTLFKAHKLAERTAKSLVIEGMSPGVVDSLAQLGLSADLSIKGR